MAKKKYVVYEVWTRSRVIEAKHYSEAIQKGEPELQPAGWNLCNWHAVPVDGSRPHKALDVPFDLTAVDY